MQLTTATLFELLKSIRGNSIQLTLNKVTNQYNITNPCRRWEAETGVTRLTCPFELLALPLRWTRMEIHSSELNQEQENRMADGVQVQVQLCNSLHCRISWPVFFY